MPAKVAPGLHAESSDSRLDEKTCVTVYLLATSVQKIDIVHTYESLLVLACLVAMGKS
jgi:hypothetical protein